MTFKPYLDILPATQRRLWPELAATPADFVPYGGTAVALRLGHRSSEDFDFFTNSHFAPSDLTKKISYLKDAFLLQSSTNILVCIVDRRGAVKVSFFGGIGCGARQ